MATFETLRADQHFLVRLEGEAQVETNAGPRSATASGELILEFLGDNEAVRGLRLHRQALVVAGVETLSGDSGALSIVAESASGIAKLADGEGAISLETVNRIHYPRLDEISGRATEKGDYYLPTTEPAAGRVTARLEAGKRRLGLSDLRVEIICAAGESDEILLVILEIPRADMVPIHSGERMPADEGQAFGNCDSSLNVNPRRLIIAPVGFRDSATDASPSGSTAAAQLGTAAAVWGKGCIQLQIKPTTFIVNATLKVSSDQTAIRASFTDPDPNAIEVYFVQNPLSSSGGGNAGAIGTAACKPVLAEPNGGNPVLVAHELGHVLGLLHPGTGSNSDAGTVMAPTGSAMNPGTNLVTHFMCTNIANPVLQTLAAESCCFTHDVGNHYLRDFPVDAGNEPSDPLPAGMTRYSMSNVWNRLSDTPGTAGSGGPAHEQPVRFNADGSAYTNYLFARVEQLANLKVRSATVRFYRKQPGSGGGAANLVFIGDAPVPDTLAVGVPQTVSIPWTVPAGTPSHSCVFAAIRSAAEPEGDQTGLNWTGFEALARADNDWAQRNLEIADYSNSNEGGGNIESAPFLIRLPIEEKEARPLRLLVSVLGKADGILVEIDGETVAEAFPGKQAEISIDGGISPGQNRVVVATAKIGGRLEDPVEVRVDPFVGDLDLVGFASRFVPSTQVTAVGQSVDTFAGAAHDADLFFRTGASAELRQAALNILAAAPGTNSTLVDQIRNAEPAFKELANELELVELAPDFGVRGATRNLLDALSNSSGSAEDEARVTTAFRSVATRLAGLASLGLESA